MAIDINLINVAKADVQDARFIDQALINDSKVDKVAGSRLIDSDEAVILSNTSGANTGDETTASIKAKRPLKTVNGGSLEGPGSITLKNYAGQIKVNYPALSVVNFTTNAYKYFNIDSVAFTISSSPTTTYPHGSNGDITDFFAPNRNAFDLPLVANPTTGRLIENPIGGQVHRWRVQGLYLGKANNQLGICDLELYNPVTQFVYKQKIPLSDGVSTDTFNLELIAIGDNASIPFPNGYVLRAKTDFNDTDFEIQIVSITRFSNAVENRLV